MVFEVYFARNLQKSKLVARSFTYILDVLFVELKSPLVRSEVLAARRDHLQSQNGFFDRKPLFKVLKKNFPLHSVGGWP